MNLNRWLNIILMASAILALVAMTAQADPYAPYHRPHGEAYGWDGPRHHGRDKHFRHSRKGGHDRHYVDRVYEGHPPVAYVQPVTPVAPVLGIPYAQPQPYYSQPGPPGLSGSLQYNF